MNNVRKRKGFGTEESGEEIFWGFSDGFEIEVEIGMESEELEMGMIGVCRVLDKEVGQEQNKVELAGHG